MNDREQVRGVIGALALVVGACLSMAGTFLELYRVSYDFGQDGESAPPPFEVKYTSWQSEVTPERNQLSMDSDVPQYGVPVVFAALLLLVCAVVLLRAASTSPRAVAVFRFTSVGAAMLLVGSAWSVGQLVWAQVSVPDANTPFTSSVGPGLWVLVIGAGVALTGALVVQQLPPALPAPTGPLVYQLEDDAFDDDLDTPPLGFEAPVVATLPPLVTHHPTGVDPSTVESRPN